MSVLKSLKVRKLVENMICPVCQDEEETVSHLFRDYNFTRQVLQELGIFNSTCNRETSWKMWLATEYGNLTDEEFKIRTIHLWAIWYNKNKIFHKGKTVLKRDIVGFINAYYAETTHIGELIKCINEINNIMWQQPKGDIIKINFDMSFNQNQHSSMSGIVVRNKNGLVMASCS
ncbi:hypothetical protein J1N35_040377 [Gossypium stocksii]|uniref:Reverse transcriptase zinc-binding domain-containing protein n=1 Tax=Gossypium stocksii TaxID=47602 RepID=A0A9D3UE35_9ROSI|nr:hypothetical protein J1N35_040377 [Gossypium stocksii]